MIYLIKNWIIAKNPIFIKQNAGLGMAKIQHSNIPTIFGSLWEVPNPAELTLKLLPKTSENSWNVGMLDFCHPKNSVLLNKSWIFCNNPIFY